MAASDSSTETLRSRLRYQEAVAELGRDALESADLDGVLTDAAAAVRDALEVDGCSILERRPDGETAVVRAAVGQPDPAAESATVSVDAGSWVAAALEGDAPVATDTERSDSNGARADRGGVVLGVRLGPPPDPWGVLGVHASEGAFTAAETDFVASIAELLETAIENDRRGVPATDAVTDGIVETSPTGITVVGADGTIEFANERAAEIFGRTRAEITALSHDDPSWDMRDEDGDPVPEGETPFERVLECERDVFDLEVSVRRPDGSRRWLSINGAPLETDDGEATSAVFAIEDVTDRKRLEGELETTYDRVTDAFFGLDGDWTFTYVNERARELIDPDDEGLLGETLWETFPAAVDSAFETEYRRAMATQEPTSFEEYFPPLEAWYEVHAYPSETGLSVYFRDVTDRKVTERELAATNHTLQRLYAITADSERTFDEQIDDLLALGRDRLGLEGGFLARVDEANDRFQVTHASGGDDRLSPGTVTSLSTAYCDRTIDSEELLAFTESPVEHGVSEAAYDEWGLDTYLGGRVIVDGETYGTLCFEDEATRSRPFTPAERSFVELATQWISYELERRARQRDLVESEQRYRTLVEHFPNGIVALFDEDLTYTLAGGEILEEIDLTPAEFVGQGVGERYEGETRETFERNFRAALAGEHRSFTFELHDREWTAHAVPVEDDRGDAFAGMLMVQDVTEARAKQRQLREREARLEASNQRLEQFAYAASHDLQEPLRMISSYLTLVERRYADELDADGKEFIEFAVDGAERMQEMIDGLLQYSRVDTQGDPFRPVDCEAVLEDVLTDLEVRIDETDAEIDVGSLPRVYGDPGQLRQLFQNLLDNAITYSGDGTPRISVFAANNGARWTVSVRDQGIGIDPDDADRIFQVFDRLHSHEEYAGTGIGLALCRRIVERHDGEITVDSDPGEGATFTVSLPAVPDAATEPATTLASDADGGVTEGASTNE